MQNIDNLLIDVETKWLKELYNYNAGLFQNKFIPSHNSVHHWRTWQNTKLILKALSENAIHLNYNFIEALFFAVFFHDTGLSQTNDEKHGYASKLICENYIKSKNIHISFLDETLEAIELHEKKDKLTENSEPGSIKTILTASDDMDAFGFAGIYRYAEIYLMRGVLASDLAQLVLHNLNNRYKNFTLNYINFPRLVNNINLRYQITNNFYQNLNLNNPEELQVIQLIENEIVNKKQNPERVFSQSLNLITTKNISTILYNLLFEIVEPKDIHVTNFN
jgi:hypothetical protein